MKNTLRNSSGSSRAYKRGAVMGLTVAEAFILLAFCLLLLFTWWQIDTERKSLAVADEIGTLTEDEKVELIAGLSDGTFEMATKLRQVGVTLADDAALADTSQYTRFMREDELKRLMKGAVELSPTTRISLADAVEIAPETKLRAALNSLNEPEKTVDIINQRLANAAARKAKAVEQINESLGDRIRSAGGKIDANGTITLPQGILFEANKDSIRDPAYLKEICVGWLETLRTSGADISELKIEGHASSEGRAGDTEEAAYLYNLGLSQRRSQNALVTCLAGIEEPATAKWARQVLTAAGYSSARPVLDENGDEDRDKSRRVMFSMAMNNERLLDDIQTDITRKDPSSSDTVAEGKKRVVGKPTVVDGDTIKFGNQNWRLFGIDAPENSQKCMTEAGDIFLCGEASTDTLIELIGDQDVECSSDEIDRYNRPIAKCFIGSTDIAAEMVRLGMAVPYLKYSKLYDPIGQEAEASKVGLWSGEFQMPWDYRTR